MKIYKQFWDSTRRPVRITKLQAFRIIRSDFRGTKDTMTHFKALLAGKYKQGKSLKLLVNLLWTK